MKVSHLWDGFLSAMAAIATSALCGVPVFYSYQAITFGIAPIWVWGFIIALGGVGFILTIAFLRKAAAGISPSRERRRR